MKTLVLVLLLMQQRAATVPHQATLYYQSSSCTSSSPCNLQVYRATCPSPTSCPAYGNGHGWIRISAVPSATTTTTGTQWVVVDQDPALKDATTYTYAATCVWVSGGSLSKASPVWIGTTLSGSSNVPAIPTVGTGNSVQ